MKSQLILVSVLTLNLVNCNILSNHDMSKFSNDLDKAKQDFNLDSFTNQWLEECERNKGSEAVETIRESFQNLTDCFSSKIAIANITDEIKIASPKGVLDEVFAKYCNQIPAIKRCRAPLFSAMEVCVSDATFEDLGVFEDAIDGALDFMCYKGGERIAIFMSENGTDCFMSKIDPISTCINGSLIEVEELFTSMQKTNSSIFSDKSCRLEAKMKSCVVDSLKKCSDPTPANVIEGLIDSMIKKTPCFVSSSGSNLLTNSSLCWMLVLITARWLFTDSFHL